MKVLKIKFDTDEQLEDFLKEWIQAVQANMEKKTRRHVLEILILTPV